MIRRPGRLALVFLLLLAVSSPLAAADYYTVTPCRLFDSRTGQIVGNNDARTVQVTGACAVPLTATAASVNVTVILPGRPGYLTLYPSGETAPATSTLNFSDGQTRSNNAVVKLGTDGAIAVLLISGSFGTADVLLDVNGYFQ